MAPSFLLFGFGFSNRGKGLPNSTRAMNICHGVLLEVRIRQETAPKSGQSILSNGTVGFPQAFRRTAPLWTQPLTLKESSAPKSTTTSKMHHNSLYAEFASMIFRDLPWCSMMSRDVPWCSVSTPRRWTEHDSLHDRAISTSTVCETDGFHQNTFTGFILVKKAVQHGSTIHICILDHFR